MNLGNKNPICCTFGERLMFLMENDVNGPIDTTRKGAERELGRRMYNKKILEYSSDDYDAQGKNRDSARKAIRTHMKLDSAENISGKWLKAYCDYFKCSADYLFGYIDLPTHLNTDIHDAIGLSNDSINVLKEWNHLAQIHSGQKHQDRILVKEGSQRAYCVDNTRAPVGQYGWASNALKGLNDLLIQNATFANNVLSQIAEYIVFRHAYETNGSKNNQNKYRLALFTASDSLSECIKNIYQSTKKAPSTN